MKQNKVGINMEEAETDEQQQQQQQQQQELEEEITKKLAKEETTELTNGFSDSVDVVDYPPNDYVFRRVDIGFIFFGVSTLIADWVFDVITAYNHYRHKDYGWFAMTVLFMSCSSLVIMGVSLYCYVKDKDKPEVPKVSPCQWRIRIILLILQLGPLLRYYDTLRFGLRSRQYWRSGRDEYWQKKYYTWMLYEDSDSVFLRMFECFLESAPQLILQLYILAQANDPVKYSDTWRYIITAGSITSLVSLAWGVMAFSRGSRFTNHNKNNISMVGSAALFFWHLFCLAARVTAVVLFALVFRLAVVYVCVAHWGVMATWLMIRRIRNCNASVLWHVALSCLIGIIYIFVFLNEKDEPTRKKYIFFYALWEAENVAMVVLWLLYGDPNTSFYLLAVIFHFISFLLGIGIMLIYYAFLHPNITPPPLLPPLRSTPTGQEVEVAGGAHNLEQTEL